MADTSRDEREALELAVSAAGGAEDRELSEEELYAPDLDDDGELDPEYYVLPEAPDDASPELVAAWTYACELLDAEQDAEQDEG